AEQLGLGRVLSHARALGVETPLREEIGTSIGGSEVTMMDVARLFATFANRGVRVAPVAISRIEDRRGKVLYESPKPELRSQRVLSEPTAYLMTEGLRSVLRLGTGHESRQLAE